MLSSARSCFLCIALIGCGRSELLSSVVSSGTGGGGGAASTPAPTTVSPAVPAGPPTTIMPGGPSSPGVTATNCGNGEVELGEQCDGPLPGSQTCASLGYKRGTLRCNAATCRFDKSDCSPPMATDQLCRRAATPVSLPAGCARDICTCDSAAFERCSLPCWERVACQIATCFKSPSLPECAAGCQGADADELILGRCYESSNACVAHQ
jgi:hypothetical protein